MGNQACLPQGSSASHTKMDPWKLPRNPKYFSLIYSSLTLDIFWRDSLKIGEKLKYYQLKTSITAKYLVYWKRKKKKKSTDMKFLKMSIIEDDFHHYSVSCTFQNAV